MVPCLAVPDHQLHLCALLRPQPQRSLRSVPEEFSAPLELPQPLSGLMDGSIPPPQQVPQRSPRAKPRVSSSQNVSSELATAQVSSSSLHPYLLVSLDYGVRPKHPWPRGPRPLLSQAQQRKRDGPNMADYYYDVNL
ncbi:uncharacterized protein C11orf94 homolog isoform X2 [Onychomys torridus]|uniref:uncharacterized protein C11orf94 homolog isoform X2 n=1 Tax=Onychomys torridus TaxID=38674 RepID=UPI00167F6E13|nr:uncharacterized protein C11orf94 homolog isoform X2 [Onychomys torridus]